MEKTSFMKIRKNTVKINVYVSFERKKMLWEIQSLKSKLRLREKINP